uniref:NADH dehydrogenase subunit 6 n=1 Tax=Trichius succinctus TaxID=1310326 RepID=UPI0020279FA6|nr:NADH dehydrogenase subunit 6 [Trichius succinctus]UQJ77500.1 NADH dehydrogenase subunit 6 [Trichius succinctus]
MLIILMSMSFICSILFMFMTHPLSMGMILLMQTLLTSLTIGLFNLNFWFSYIMFIIMVGGMLVLFIYMTSVASNEKFSFSIKIVALLLLLLTLLTGMYLLLNTYFFNLNNKFEDNIYQNFYVYNYSLNKFLNFPSIIIMYLLIIYLLITMIAVVKITDIKQGPLRQLF